MGQNNRQRRAAKAAKANRVKQHQRQKTRSSNGGADRDEASSYESDHGVDAREMLGEVFVWAAKSAVYGDTIRQQEMTSVLIDAPPNVVDQAIDERMSQVLHIAANRGILPADVERLVRLHANGEYCVSMAIDFVMAQTARYESENRCVDQLWASQLEVLEAVYWWSTHHGYLSQWQCRYTVSRRDAVVLVVELLSILMQLPFLDRLRPGPDEWPKRTERPISARCPKSPSSGSQVAKMMEKIRALLAKAESTTFDEEAESLTAKAQELMTRHAIDQAMLHATGSGNDDDGPQARRIEVADPYARGKASLMHAVAEANDCRAVWSKEAACCTVVGHLDDVEMVELLYTSLLLQASHAMVAAGSQRDQFGRSTTRSFRLSFWFAFASRIGKRLQEARAATVDAVSTELGTSVLPVLASKERKVESEYERLFPHVSTHSTSVSNHAGWIAGSVAANSAVIDVREQIKT
jgi:hypothetical protein